MKIISKTMVLPADNVDTDQIIPARFLKTTSKEGLGDQLFCDWRYGAGGAPNPDFILNRAEAKDAQVLVAGANFGCGSSREHAAWALLQFGFRAVVSTSFGDIFRQNALKNGLLAIAVPGEAHAALVRSPGAMVYIDLAAQTLKSSGGGVIEFEIDAFAKYCLLEEVDELGYILQHEQAIAAYEHRAGRSPMAYE